MKNNYYLTFNQTEELKLNPLVMQRVNVTEPTAEAIAEAIKAFMDKGFAVYIFSTRKPRQIQKWLNKEGRLWFHDAFAGPAPFDSGYGDDKAYMFDFKSEVIPRRTKFWDKPYILGVTNKKLPAYIYIDDRAYRFESWKELGAILQEAELKAALNHRKET